MATATHGGKRSPCTDESDTQSGHSGDRKRVVTFPSPSAGLWVALVSSRDRGAHTSPHRVSPWAHPTPRVTRGPPSKSSGRGRFSVCAGWVLGTGLSDQPPQERSLCSAGAAAAMGLAERGGKTRGRAAISRWILVLIRQWLQVIPLPHTLSWRSSSCLTLSTPGHPLASHSSLLVILLPHILHSWSCPFQNCGEATLSSREEDEGTSSMRS